MQQYSIQNERVNCHQLADRHVSADPWLRNTAVVHSFEVASKLGDGKSGDLINLLDH
jgi:hypothetical protein